MKLIEFDETHRISREEAAGHLHRLADMLERHNNIEVSREGVRYSVAVADQVTVEYELEVTDTGGEIEIEISW